MFGLQFFNEMNNFQREIDQLLRGAQANAIKTTGIEFKVRENDNNYEIAAAIPALDTEKLEISVLERKLSIAGDIAKAELPEGAEWVRQERRAGHFEHSFQLQPNLDTENIEAHYRNGILTLVLPKQAEVQPKKIEISIA